MKRLIKSYEIILGMSSHWREVLRNMSKQVKNDASFGTVKVNFIDIVSVLIECKFMSVVFWSPFHKNLIV